MLRKDPLVHFLIIGGLLFLALTRFGNGSDDGASSGTILITADRVAEIARQAALLQGRPPTDEELERLVAGYVRDEVYYREALALGLDVDDDEVRTRLIEKMRYVTENVADPEPPESDLVGWFEDNAERFRIPELVTFDQVFFSPRMRGEAAETDAEAALAGLQGGGSPENLGDPTPLQSRFEAADADRVRVLFGEALTEAVFAAPPAQWIGPFESDFGWHVVRVVERTAARDPEFAEIEAVVREAWAAERLAAANDAAFEEMRAGFDIAVQWEADAAPEVWP